MLDYFNRILLVEDDPSLGFVIKDNLNEAGFEVDWQKDGDAGFEAYYQNKYDLCILDVMLPKKDGFTLAEDIKKLNKEAAIIFLTAKSQELDRLKGFQSGGDDYLTKPFAMEELIARMQAIIKRVHRHHKMYANNGKDKFEFGQCHFNYSSLKLNTPKDEYQLTAKEGELMRMLCIHLNQTLARSIALKLIWGQDDYFLGRSMDVFIARLRKYLKDDESVAILNEPGIGFRLSDKL